MIAFIVGALLALTLVFTFIAFARLAWGVIENPGVQMPEFFPSLKWVAAAYVTAGVAYLLSPYV